MNLSYKKFLYQAILSLFCTIGFFSCIDDVDDCKEPLNDTDFPECYVEVNIQVPGVNNTRSETNSGGNSGLTDNGIAAETSINSINLYFYDASDSDDKLLCVISSSTGSTEDTGIKVENNTNTGEYKLTSKVSVENLKKILGKEVRIYALANMKTWPETEVGVTTENGLLAKVIGSEYISPFTQTDATNGTTYGMVCPMANYQQFEVDFSNEGTLATPSATASDGEVMATAEKVFTQPYKTKDRKYLVSDKLELERMIARVDFKGSGFVTLPPLEPEEEEEETEGVGEDEEETTPSNKTYDFVYLMPKAESTIAACNATGADKGVYLKVVDISLKKIGGGAYVFRHTWEGDRTGIDNEKVLSIFGIENGNDNTDPEDESYNWIADSDWGGKTYFGTEPKSTPESITEWLKTGDDYVVEGGYSPWYYINENTVPSTEMMGVSNNTYLEFKVALWDASTRKVYKNTSNTSVSDEVRITMTETSKYQNLEKDSDGSYYLTYKYVIPHNIRTNSTGVSGSTGTVGNSFAPMQYGIVRNCIYQIGLTGIKNLPDEQEPDNFYLAIELRVLAWARRDITVSW